ncbi:PREDICTED: gem-associated protein 8-like [Nicrophorus vespilloides]|uniref:Gem-associated protein 8-like n=1 Tax=Nicrophorus vespilloides TaxID=110193 RepID=A0ABM1MEI1_NICVS|nr:PREDICTED: gem-associated protein 8-like [Nicrophorus vespilloides]
MVDFNMADGDQVILPVEKKYSKLQIRKFRRSKNRRLRRKRSNLRFRRELSVGRISRASLEVIDISDMECNPHFGQTITEVAQWQGQHATAYWKSRAISLEYENRMLHEHIKKLYLGQIDECKELKHEEELEPEWKNEEEGQKKRRCKNKWRDDRDADVPREEEKMIQHIKHMKDLYGNNASKINGMEVAVQLNYDFHSTKSVYWPNLPLNL